MIPAATHVALPVTLTLATRVAGGLLGIGVAEARAASGRLAPLATARAASRPLAVLTEAGGDPSALKESLTGIGAAAAPAWFLPVAVAHPDPHRRRRITQELGLRSGVTPSGLAACVDFVELAATILTGRGPDLGQPAEQGPLGPDVAVFEARWALAHPGPLPVVLDALASHASFGGLASGAALLGLRDGFGPMLAAGYRPAEPAWSCLALTPGLIRARTSDQPDPRGGGRR